MRLEARKYLDDIKQAADLIGWVTAGKQFTDYAENSMLRAAVERKFEIIAFRNILMLGYTEIDDRLVWDFVENKLPLLRREVDELQAKD